MMFRDNTILERLGCLMCLRIELDSKIRYARRKRVPESRSHVQYWKPNRVHNDHPPVTFFMTALVCRKVSIRRHSWCLGQQDD